MSSHNLKPAGDLTEAEMRERLADQLDHQADLLEAASLNTAFQVAAVISLRARAASLRKGAVKCPSS